MKIKEGMYARVKGNNNFPGGIAKILKIKEEKGKKWLTLDKALDYSFLALITNVIKVSYDPTDLMRVGDVIAYRENIEGFDLICVNNMFDDEVLKMTIDKIRKKELELVSVMTKEQFESISYKVGE